MKKFTTTGELAAILNKLPKNTPIFVCGTIGYYFELAGGKSICLDCENLEDEEFERGYYTARGNTDCCGCGHDSRLL